MSDPALDQVRAATSLDAENPWPGLESFQEGDARFFRGRAAAAEELLRLVHRERLTVLFGISGLGKSSLFQAGLFPRLRQQRMLPIQVRLLHEEDAPPPRSQILDAIRRAAKAAAVEAPPLAAGETLWEHFHRQGAGYWTADNLPVTPVLVFDQFEEAFTLGRQSVAQTERTAAFLEELGDLIEGRVPASVREHLEEEPTAARNFLFNRHPYKVLLGLREDFLAELETLRPRIPSIGSNRFRLTPLSGEAALEVTSAGGADLVPAEVGERIVRLVAADEDAARPLSDLTVDPALLSLFCRELNERRKALGQRAITPDLVEGHRESILAAFYERSVADLDPGVRHLVEERLLTVGGYRNSEALENALAQPGVTARAIDELVARRLIRREEREGRTRIELTHDVLTGVVRDSRDRRQKEEAVAQAAAEVARQRRAAAATARQLRKSRRVSRAMALVVLVALGFGIDAWRQRGAAQRERDAAERHLARTDFDEALRMLEADRPLDALAWLGRAIRRDPGHVSSTTLAFTLLQQTYRPVRELLPEEGGFITGTLTDDGRFLVVATSRGRLEVWDTETLERLRGLRHDHDGPVRSISTNADASRILVRSRSVAVWDGASGSPVGPPIEADELDTISAARLDPSGDMAYVHVIGWERSGDDYADVDGRIERWDLASATRRGSRSVGAEIRTMATNARSDRVLIASDTGTITLEGEAMRTIGPAVTYPARIRSVAFSADGDMFAVALEDGTAHVRSAAGSLVTVLDHLDLAAAVFSPDGRRLITHGRHELRVWELDAHTPTNSSFRTVEPIAWAAFHPDGRRILTISEHAPQHLTVWEPPLGPLPPTTVLNAEPHTVLAFSADLGRAVTATGPTAQIWDLQNPGRRPITIAHGGAITQARFNSDGSLVATASGDSTARLWNVIDGSLAMPPLRLGAPVRAVALNADGSLITAATADTLVEWVVRTGQRTERARSIEGFRVDSVAYHRWVTDRRAGLRLAVEEGPVINRTDEDHDGRCDSRDGWMRQVSVRPATMQVAGHTYPEFRVVYVCSRDADRLVEVRAGRLRSSTSVSAWAMSPSGDRILTGTRDGVVQQWDTWSAQPAGLPLELTEPIVALAYDQTGERALVILASGWSEVLDVRTGYTILTFPAGHPATAGAFSRDGRRIVLHAGGDMAAWKLPATSDHDALHLARLLELVSYRRVDDSGVLVDLKGPFAERDTLSAIRTIRSEAAGHGLAIFIARYLNEADGRD